MSATIPNAALEIWPAIRRQYAWWSLLLGSVGVMIAMVATGIVGGTGQALGVVTFAMIFGSLAAVAPMLLQSKAATQSFGIAVLAAGVARMLIVGLIVVVAAAAMDLPRKPIGLGVGAGLLFLLMTETMLALAMLSRLDSATGSGKTGSLVEGVKPSTTEH